MFQPLSVFIGLRYVRSRQHKFFVSLITWVSLAGVSLGVAALIVILSVMNGFEGELRDRLLVAECPGARHATGRGLERRRAGAARAPAALPGVVGVAPYMELTALAVQLPDMLPVVLRGIDPRARAAVADVRPLMVEGGARGAAARQQCGDPRPRHRRSARRARRRSGDAAGADGDGERHSRAAPARSSRSAGVFEAGLEEHDNTLILAQLD